MKEIALRFMETGDDIYFTKIYEKLNKPLLNFIKKSIKDNDTAHEILSLTFERIFISLKENKYTPMKNIKFSTWAHTCALNSVRYYYRYYNKTAAKDVLPIKNKLDTSVNIEEKYIYTTKVFQEVIEYIRNVLTEKNNLRYIAKRIYINGDKLNDIAYDLNYNVGQVKYRVFKIKNEIKANIKYNAGTF